jgi:DNA-binding SARP family transcriptional activator
MSELDVRLFGRFRVLRDGVELLAPRGLAAAVLKLLVLNGGVAHQERVIEHLWPGDPLLVGRGRLKNAVGRLARSPGITIRSRHRATIELQDQFRCDLADFIRDAPRALSGALSRDECMRLQELWVGPPLEDNLYDSWAEEYIEQAQALKQRLWAMLDATRDPDWRGRQGTGPS